MGCTVSAGGVSATASLRVYRRGLAMAFSRITHQELSRPAHQATRIYVAYGSGRSSTRGSPFVTDSAAQR